MTAKMKHLAIVSSNYAIEGQFYQALFGMRTFASDNRLQSAVAVSDGYVGLNVNPRKAGRQAGFDHFGFEVDDVEQVFARATERWPQAQWLKRPSNRPFAGISMNDPCGNVFDLSQRGMENRTDVYVADIERTPRHVSHFQLRTVNPEQLAQFYTDVLDLEEVEQTPDNHFHLSDGTVTMVIAPWKITDYAGSGIERPAPDHIGFEVESLAEFEKDLESITVKNHYLAPSPLGAGPEGEARLKLFKGCRYGRKHLADPDGVLICVGEHKQ
ncbi:MAG TPA: VOC family protein [Chloroflexota bacterium]|nr:VOC family protein [Chloroflexota bacterium]